MKSLLLIYLLAFVLTSCEGDRQVFESHTPNNNFKMNTIEFHQWVLTTSFKCEEENIHPNILKEKLLARLKQDHYALDSSVIKVVNALYGYEGRQNTIVNDQFSETIALIDTIEPMLYDRNHLRASLLMLKASILNLKRQEKNAAEELDKSIALLYPMHLEIDKKRMESMLRLAELSLWKNHNKAKAENLYLDILSYPWTLVEDPGYFQVFREYYIQAGLGLIKCRKTSLEALKEIFFVPAVSSELMPALNKAIQEVKK